MTRRYIYDLLKDKEAVVRDCVSFHKGEFPKECFTAGFVYHYGERVTLDDFIRCAKKYNK